MHACFDRCRSAILEIRFIGLLRIQRWSAGSEIGHDHIGDDGTGFD
jgi:hypothetical protein